MIMDTAKWILAGLALSLAAGCDTPTQSVGATKRVTAPYVEVQHQYRFASGSATLSSQERGRISSFLGGLALRSGDAIIVTIPSSGKTTVDAQRQSVMRSILSGYPAKAQFLQDTSFGARPSPYRQVGIIRVTRARGLQVSCQAGVDDLGCASAANLAAMIHDPGDVLSPDSTAAMAQRDMPNDGFAQ